MEYLSWDLSLLTRATQYANLSIASAHVGISQPQLSRIVAKLEEQLGLQLLDRESRRKSAWTPVAHQLAEIYHKTSKTFRSEIGALVAGLAVRELHVGTLEGLVPTAMAFCKAVLEQTKVMVVQLEVLDTSPLEERFAKDELDLIFTARDMGARKYRYLQVLGYQSLDTVRQQGELKVFSTFEYASVAHKELPKEKAFISNSLRVRQDWLAEYGGVGILPSPLRSKKTSRKGEVTVMAVAHDSLPSGFWDEVRGFLRPSP